MSEPVTPSYQPPGTVIHTENAFVRFLRLIRFSHTVFALPFALGSLVVAAHGHLNGATLLLVLICMVFARTSAMLFNRLVDWSLDKRNPRTSGRHLLLERRSVLLCLAGSTLAFVFTAACINFLTALLAPFAVALIFFYSLAKRFTSATHFILGAALAAAPVGAWIAQTGEIGLPPVILALGVVCWVAGFDIIYATQDAEFDRAEGLHSLVPQLGLNQSLRLAQKLHLAMFAALILFGIAAHLGIFFFAAMPVVAGALVYEHRSAGQNDIAAVNRAFFNSNAFVSVVFLVAVCLDQFF